MRALALLSAIICVCLGGMGSASADTRTYDFSYSSPGVSSVGTFTAEQDSLSPNVWQIISGSAVRNGTSWFYTGRFYYDPPVNATYLTDAVFYQPMTDILDFFQFVATTPSLPDTVYVLSGYDLTTSPPGAVEFLAPNGVASSVNDISNLTFSQRVEVPEIDASVGVQALSLLIIALLIAGEVFRTRRRARVFDGALKS